MHVSFFLFLCVYFLSACVFEQKNDDTVCCFFSLHGGNIARGNMFQSSLDWTMGGTASSDCGKLTALGYTLRTKWPRNMLFPIPCTRFSVNKIELNWTDTTGHKRGQASEAISQRAMTLPLTMSAKLVSIEEMTLRVLVPIAICCSPVFCFVFYLKLNYLKTVFCSTSVPLFPSPAIIEGWLLFLRTT